MTNKTIGIIVAVLAIVALGAGTMYLFNWQMPLQSYNPKTQGKVVFGVTDVAEDMSGVSSVFVTVNKVEIHSATKGWVTASNETKQYDLLALKQSGAVSLLANANVDVGTYDQMRLMISKVTVVKNGVSQDAKLPSGELKIISDIVVNADKTLTVVFDFMADKSLHITGNGKFIFTPVIKVKKQSNANVELKSNGEINIMGGNQENDENVGMDEKGEVKNDFELKGDLDIDENDDIKIKVNIEGNIKTDNELVFNFSAQNNSGVSGTAILEGDDGNIEVALKLKNSVLGILSPAQPAHIHFGSCSNIGGVKYPLNSVVNGKSETVLNVSLTDLKAQLPLAINVHKSAAESNIYIACTDLNF
ncbi:MAG TPA: DUF4382 domain-containing protein [Candidatus Wunengus sp. YC61]|uniref:DUF4382 domain-containing protein n=1 Tax=Candidatus Wunengus sp. YC61 TaxID=3367698 RepID=UPI0040274254